MRVEIYDEGKCLKDISTGELSVLSYYIGVDSKGVAHAENNITLGIGTDDYWSCLIKKQNLQCFVKQKIFFYKINVQRSDSDGVYVLYFFLLL